MRQGRTEIRISQALNALAKAERACENGNSGDASEWIQAATESLLDTKPGHRSTGMPMKHFKKAKIHRSRR